MKFSGEQELVVFMNTKYDFLDINKADSWMADSDGYVAVSKPFTVTIEEVDDANLVINQAKVKAVDKEIVKALAEVNALKEKRAKLLALPSDCCE